MKLILAILKKFRLKKNGVIVDIRRDFLQITLNERDTLFKKSLCWVQSDHLKLAFQIVE